MKGGGIKFAKQAKTYCPGLNKRRYNKTGVRYLEIVKNPEKKGGGGEGSMGRKIYLIIKNDSYFKIKW